MLLRVQAVYESPRVSSLHGLDLNDPGRLLAVHLMHTGLVQVGLNASFDPTVLTFMNLHNAFGLYIQLVRVVTPW
jgi:hypothetical protein